MSMPNLHSSQPTSLHGCPKCLVPFSLFLITCTISHFFCGSLLCCAFARRQCHQLCHCSLLSDAGPDHTHAGPFTSDLKTESVTLTKLAHAPLHTLSELSPNCSGERYFIVFTFLPGNDHRVMPGPSLSPSLARNWTALGSSLSILRRADQSSNSTAIPCGETRPVIPWTRCCPC
ncbi:hypothetical protein EV401DRAFT_829297 [Pisolithus croceorrhizus]|nr:hypothetical protein EV401DRAFT_829297 [Pisolithus croceorrhizus]